MDEARKKVKYEKRIAKLTGKAIFDYKMIKENEHVVVALSGGKDSLCLLHILWLRKKWLPVDYKLYGVHIKSNTPCASAVDTSYLKSFCDKTGAEYIERVITPDEAKTSLCFWCSWNRRKELFNLCGELGAAKLALGHHKDDITETLLLNLFYHGEYSTMPPMLSFFDNKIDVIRPLAYVEEHMLKRYALEHDFKTSTCDDTFSKNSKRFYVKELIRELKKDIPSLKSNLFNSMKKEIKKDYIL
jgi:tRNA(Ile)-lysidine synthase TilS/MesJ